MIHIQIDETEFKKSLHEWEDQYEYAMSQTINDTLKDAQRTMVGDINDKFTVRRKAFVQRSVKISKFAKKTDLEGIVGIENIAGKPTADILSKFEEGGDKHPRGQNVAVPTEFVRPVADRVITAGKRPRNLKNSFKMSLRTGVEVLAQRISRGKNAGLRIAYVLKPLVSIDNRLHFRDTVIEDINKNFEKNWEKNAIKAISTRR